MRFALKRRRNRTLKGGVDPREAQARSVEARRQRKQARTVELSDSPVLVEPRGLTTSPRTRGGSSSLTGSHERPVAPKTNRTTEDVVREIDAAYRRVEKPKPPKKDTSGDWYSDLPREPGENNSDYQLRKALKSQADWRAKQAGYNPAPLPPRIIPSPEQWMG